MNASFGRVGIPATKANSVGTVHIVAQELVALLGTERSPVWVKQVEPMLALAIMLCLYVLLLVLPKDNVVDEAAALRWRDIILKKRVGKAKHMDI